MPSITDKGKAKEFIGRRHPEYISTVFTVEWILDTLESGDRYRDASYGIDRRGKPVHNLFRQRREYPDLGGTPTDEMGVPLPFHLSSDEQRDHVAAVEFDYELRRQRTPVPNMLATFIRKQLSKIYKRPIAVEAEESLLAWSENIDGRETTLEEWMRNVVGPLLCALGMIDVGFDHPERPEGEPILFDDDLSDSRKRCIVYYILPTNVLWWKRDYTGQYYIELLVREFHEDESGKTVERFRHWTVADWTLYDSDGEVVDSSDHSYGMVPVVRLFDIRNLRCDHIAISRMWGIVDKTRVLYNEESEMIANNTMHNTPLLQGPGPEPGEGREDVPIGRYYLLHKQRDQDGTYVGYEYVSPPTETSAFMRLRLFDLREQMEQEAGLTRSLGSVGTERGAGPVAQSGVSKAYDQVEGSDYLASIAKMLEEAHYAIMYFALIVLRDGWARVKQADIDSITVVYPKEFNLLTFDQFSLIVTTMQTYIIGGLGYIPSDEKETLRQFVRMKHPDLGVRKLKRIDREIDRLVTDAVESRKKKALAPPAPPQLQIGGPGQPNGQPPRNGQPNGQPPRPGQGGTPNPADGGIIEGP
jgi:hypothetical protein